VQCAGGEGGGLAGRWGGSGEARGGRGGEECLKSATRRHFKGTVQNARIERDNVYTVRG